MPWLIPWNGKALQLTLTTPFISSWFNVRSNLLQPVTQGTRIHATAHMLVITDTQVGTGRYKGGCRICYSGYKDTCYSSYAGHHVLPGRDREMHGGVGSVTEGTRIQATAHMLDITDAQVGIGGYREGGGCRIYYWGYKDTCYSSYAGHHGYTGSNRKLQWEGGLGSVTQGTRIHATTHILVITDTQVETGRYREGCRIFYSR